MKVGLLDLSNYGSKAYLKNAAGASNLSNLKSRVDKLDVEKLVPVPVDLSKVSDVVKYDVVKKTEYNAKVKYIENRILDIIT